MTDPPEQPKRSRGRPRKFGRRQNFNFRLTDELRERLITSAEHSGRSLSEEIEFQINRAFEWERVLGDVEAFRADLANMKTQWAEAQPVIERTERRRAGWGEEYNPVTGQVTWFRPGSHTIPPRGAWVDSNGNASPAPPTLPPALADAMRAEMQSVVRAEVQSAVKAEVQSAVREILQEAGLLPSQTKKSGGAAA